MGGTTKNPTFKTLGDHTEAIRVEFEPGRLPELLPIFWTKHNPYSQNHVTKYKNVIWTTTPAQMEFVLSERNRLQKESGRNIETQLTKAPTFYLAESYHQKYYLRENKALLAAHPELNNDERLLSDPAATKLNAKAAGHVIEIMGSMAS
eukprot:comp15398_c0_seq1/m.23369 comp15398_c0_seq1/g.23369  ORF comp15398_c0_seq1/g.23369 comp15398_c0_seq1/m.23369 type:complete len:149 (-) comp15398_c0_seq1:963-1409(-)